MRDSSGGAYPLRLAAFLSLAGICAALVGCKASPNAEGQPGSAGAAQQSATPGPTAAPSNTSYGKPGDPIQLVVGFQPYYSESWSGLLVDGLGLWKKHLPAQSSVKFEIGLQGAIIVNAMLAGKQQIGYLGDMPAIVSTTKRDVADIRIVANVGLGTDQCNVFFT